MIKYVFSKTTRFFCRLIFKVIYFLVPFFSKIFVTLRFNSRIINQLNRTRHEVHRKADYSSFISKLLLNKKLVALDVGAQGGFLNNSIFNKEYDDFFNPIVVEPLKEEADKLVKKNYKVVSKGLWSSNCKKKLYVLGNRPGSSSMYKPNKDYYDLYNFKNKNFSLFDIKKEVEVECVTLKGSLNELNINYLDFLKVDTQGAELEIIKGMGDYRPLLIKIEVQVVPMYENVPSWSELVSYLYKMNYMTCEWIEIGTHLTRCPAEMDMIFVPNYLNDTGRKIILSREKEFISLMIIFGQIKLLQIISKKLNFSDDFEIQNLKDKFFY